MKDGWEPRNESLAREKWPKKRQLLDDLLTILSCKILRKELKKHFKEP